MKSDRVYRLAAKRHRGYQGSYGKELPWKKDVYFNVEICQDFSCNSLLFPLHKPHPQCMMRVVWTPMKLEADKDWIIKRRRKFRGISYGLREFSMEIGIFETELRTDFADCPFDTLIS